MGLKASVQQLAGSTDDCTVGQVSEEWIMRPIVHTRPSNLPLQTVQLYESELPASLVNMFTFKSTVLLSFQPASLKRAALVAVPLSTSESVRSRTRGTRPAIRILGRLSSGHSHIINKCCARLIERRNACNASPMHSKARSEAHFRYAFSIDWPCPHPQLTLSKTVVESVHRPRMASRPKSLCVSPSQST